MQATLAELIFIIEIAETIPNWVYGAPLRVAEKRKTFGGYHWRDFSFLLRPHYLNETYPGFNYYLDILMKNAISSVIAVRVVGQCIVDVNGIEPHTADEDEMNSRHVDHVEYIHSIKVRLFSNAHSLNRLCTVSVQSGMSSRVRSLKAHEIFLDFEYFAHTDI